MTARILILSACLLVGAAVMARGRGPAVLPPHDSLAILPMQLGAWNGREAEELSDSVLNMLSLDDYINRVYIGPEGPVSLYIGYHKAGGFHSPLNCMPGAGWNPVQKSFLDIPVERQGSINVNRIVIMKGIDKQVVLYWYQGCGRVTASEYWGLIYGMLDKMRKGRTDAALVRIVCPAASLEAEAEEAAGKRAVDFAEILYPLLNRYIPD